MDGVGHGREGGNADEEKAVEESKITPETATINNGSNLSGSQGPPTKRQRRGRPPKFSSSCAEEALKPCQTTEQAAAPLDYHYSDGGTGSARRTRQAKAVASKSMRSHKSHEEDYDRTDNSDHKPDDDNEDSGTVEDSDTDLDNNIASSSRTQSLLKRKQQRIKTIPASPVSGISWRSACPSFRTGIEGRGVSSLGLWKCQNSEHITFPSAPLCVTLSEGSNHQHQQRIKTGRTMEILPFSGKMVERRDADFPDIFCNIGGKVLCAAPLVIPQYSAYNVKESSKSGGKYLYIAIGMDILTEVSTLVSSSEHPLCSPPFHAFGKSYPAPNLLQLWRISLPWSKKCTEGGEVALSYCISHMGGRVLNVAWAPDSPIPPPADSISSEDNQATTGIPLGLLAAACGDGAVRVFLCPEPSHVGQQHGNQNESEGVESIKVLDERPAAMITLQEGILLTCVSWSPHEHMLLACGATDGSVSLWQLQPSSSHDDEGSKDLLLTPIPVQILLDISRGVSEPVGTMTRDIEWSPYDKNVLSSVGQRNTGKMWDIREPFFPNSVVYDTFRKGEDAYDICWCPLGQRRVFLAHVGGVKLVSMNGKYCSLIKNKELEMIPDDIAWGVDAVKIGPGRLASVVVALPDGTVRLFQVPIDDLQTKPSKRRGGLGYTVVHRIVLNRNPQRGDLLDPPLTCHSSISTDKEWEDEEMKEDSSTQASVKKKHLIPWEEVNTVVQFARLDGRRIFSSPPIIEHDSANFAVIVGGYSGLLRCFVADEAILKSF